MNCECEKEEKNNKIKWFIFLLLLILLVLEMSIVLLFCKRRNNDGNIAVPSVPAENVSGGVGLVMDPNAENSLSYENDNETAGTQA